MTTTTVTTPQGTVEHIDPTVIVVEANVRTDAKLPVEFLASIKQNGVLTPILARRDEQGNVIVRANGGKTIHHPRVGDIEIEWDAYPVPRTNDASMIVITPRPGSEDSLHVLGTLAVSPPTPACERQKTTRPSRRIREER